jgi:hypothetical protein
MSCCSPIIQTFFNVPSTTIGYSPSLQAQYGAAPKVTVLYWDGTQYVAAGISTQIAFDGYPVNSIAIDHGGPATGIVKIG